MYRRTVWNLAASALVTLGATLPSAAWADAKYVRKTVDIKVEQTEKTKALEIKSKDKEKAPPPDISADQFFFIQGEVQNIRDEQIQEFMELIKDTADDDPEKADLLFRLAEQYAQKMRYWKFRSLEALTKAESTRKPAEKAKWQREFQSAGAQEKKELINAVKIYKAIAENPRFKNYGRMDEALFYYAYTLTAAKYDDEARKVFHRLIKDYPNSKYIPDAYLAFAEDYFKNNELDLAGKFYDKVLEFPKAKAYVFALYMKGWVLYNQARPEDSLAAWLKVTQLTQGDKKQAQINRTAKKDFVRAYADVGKPELAYKAFQRVDPDYSFKMLSFLGEYYLSQGKADKTIYTYRELISLDPKNKEVCEWQYTVVRAMMTIGTPEQKVKELGNLLKLYDFVKAKNVIPQQQLHECRENAQSTTGELAKVWHQEGLKTLNFQTLGYAHALYKLYMEHFPDAEDASEMQFYYAELIWKRAEGEKNSSLAAVRWEEAAVEYTKVVETAKDKKILKEAAYATVLAWKNALAVDPSTERVETDADKVPDAAPKAEPIPEKEMKMIAAFDVYIKYVTDANDDELTVIKFLKGRIYWKYKNYDKAIPLFEDLIRTRPDHETAEFAANLLLDSLARSGDTKGLVKWVDRMASNAKLLEGRDDLKTQLGLLKRQTMRKMAEKLEKDGRYRECGNAYIDIYNKYPDGTDLAEVLYNAGVCFEKARLVGRAIFARKQLTEKFPGSNLAQKAQYALGVNYASIASYGPAADQYEIYAKKFGGEKNASDALNNAVFFRKGLGQDDKAIDNTSYFIKQYGNKQPKEAASAFFSIADIYEKRKDYDKVVKHLTDYLKQWGKKGGVDRQIMAHVKMGEILWKRSCPVKGVGGACIEVKRERALKTTGKKSKRGVGITQCGPASKNKIIVHTRKGVYVKEAQQHFNTAMKLFRKGEARKDVGGKDDAEKEMRTAQMIYWVGAAHFYLAEAEYEEFLALSFPDKLDFSEKNPKKSKESEKRFKKWFEDKAKQGKSSQDAYMYVVGEIKGGGAHWAIASAARIGQIQQNFADGLFTAEIPKDLRTGPYAEEATEAYCDKLTDAAMPLEQKSVEAFSFCLDKALQLNWSNEWSRLCEGELAQIQPQNFPTAGEIRAAADEVPRTLDVQDILPDIATGDDDEPPKAASK